MHRATLRGGADLLGESAARFQAGQCIDAAAQVLLVVLDLGLGQRSARRGRPVHWSVLLVHQATLHAGGKDAQLRGDKAEVHGPVRRGVAPVGKDGELLELVPLPRQLAPRDAAGNRADVHRRQLGHVGILAKLGDSLDLDRQAVAVPAGHIVHATAAEHLVADDKVLEDLVERVAHVQAAVRIRRAVVQHKLVLAVRRAEVLALPAVQPRRRRMAEQWLALHRMRAQAERRRGEVQRVAETLVVRTASAARRRGRERRAAHSTAPHHAAERSGGTECVLPHRARRTHIRRAQQRPHPSWHTTEARRRRTVVCLVSGA